MRYLLFALALATAAAQTTQPAAVDPVASAACAIASTHAPPPIVPRSANDLAFLTTCQPYVLYYGTRGPADYAAARRCALFQSEASAKDGNYGDYGLTPLFTLAMIYANGDGVEKDVDIPVHFACLGSEPYRKGDAWVDFIDFLAARKTNNSAPRFDYCRGKLPASEPAPIQAYDKLDNLECESVLIDLANRSSNMRLAAIAAKWAPAQQASFRVVTKALDAYAKAEGSAEAEPCASGAASEEMEGEQAVRKEFGDDLERFSRGGLPRFTAVESAHAEDELNRLYRQAMEEMKSETGECAHSPEPLRDAERAWLAYRDAWVKFARSQWPAVSPGSWIAFLDGQRMSMMKSEH